MLRRLVHARAVGADGVRGVVVGHDVDDVRAIGRARRPGHYQAGETGSQRTHGRGF